MSEQNTTIAANRPHIDLPDDIRLTLGLPLGVKIAYLRQGQTVTLIPVRPIQEYAGMLKGTDIDFTTIREKQDKHQ